MATHSRTLAWKIPWTEKPGRLRSMGLLRVGHDWAASLSCTGEGNGNPLQCLAWRIPGTGEPGGLPSMGLHRVRNDWSDLAAAASWIHQKFIQRPTGAANNWSHSKERQESLLKWEENNRMGKTIEISSRKLEIPREHFMHRWAW